MKKPSKATKSPAPATRPAAKPAAKRPPAAVAAKAKRSAPSAKTKHGAPAKAPALPTVTIISARIDVGYGNHLYLRGEGAGLSWDEGVLLENLESDHWKIALPGATEPIRFKFLLNDETWSSGEDFVAVPGGLVVFTPLF